MPRRYYPRPKLPYSRNWPKVQHTLRRIIGHCEMCGSTQDLSVHHRGVPFADGRPNHPANKRDLRRENLQVLCKSCHSQVEEAYQRNQRNRAKKTAWKRTALARFNVGTGLVPYDPHFLKVPWQPMSEHPFCDDFHCPCHEDMGRIFVFLMVPYDQGILTTEEAVRLYVDEQVPETIWEVQ